MKRICAVATTFAVCAGLFLANLGPAEAQTIDVSAKTDQELAKENAALRRQNAELRERLRHLEAKKGLAATSTNASRSVQRLPDAATYAQASAAPAPIDSWSGFYVGADAGMRSTKLNMGIGDYSSVVTNAGIPQPPSYTSNSALGTPTVPFNSTAFRFGGYLGYNYQIARWILGVEANVGYANQNFENNVPVLQLTPAGDANIKTTWDGALRARLGYLVTPNVLFYAAGGAAWQHVDVSLICGTGQGCGPTFGGVLYQPVSAGGSYNRLGWTLGGGLEAALWPNWIVRAEYRYADFGTINVPATAFVNASLALITISENGVHPVALRTHTATLGIAYKFGGAP